MGGGAYSVRENLRKARKAAGLTQQAMADKLGFGDLNAVRPRLNELEKMEIVHVIDKRINPHSGVNNAVYELKREGQDLS